MNIVGDVIGSEAKDPSGVEQHGPSGSFAPLRMTERALRMTERVLRMTERASQDDGKGAQDDRESVSG
jgi:hypothetical protein